MYSIRCLPVLWVLAVVYLLGASRAAPTISATITSPIDTPPPTATGSAPQDGNFVVTVINSHTAGISTMHQQDVNGSTAIRQNNEGNIVKPSETFTFAVPTGWSGRLAMWEEGFSSDSSRGSVQDRASLFEGSFIQQDGTDSAVAFMDVSYVDGFTVPMVCECNGQVAFGCNLDLHEICPAEFQLNPKTCKNPYRDDGLKVPPTTNIFGECSKIAYTFSTDDLATHMGVLGCDRNVLCCVGTACSPHPNQKVCASRDGGTQTCGKMEVGG
ncbi:hypothetical protein GGR53DRAFT_393703 [Hypoxylon sp. FL1150]|nr:hypothetical protein GGR53DRAFT_393703 [Hypoxylon sp. FL1150]